MLRFCFIIALAIGAAGCAPGIAAPTQPQKPPNVVFVVIDALRVDRIDGERNGVPLMPYLSRFAKDCVCFSNAVTPCTWTRPAMASIFTSLFVDTHQIYHGSDSLPSGIETMATYLKNAGYSTVAVQANANLKREVGFAQGFDQYDFLDKAEAAAVTGRALERLQSPTQPFFLYVHYMDTHLPYLPPESYRTLLGYPDPHLDPKERAIAEHFMPYFWDYVDYLLGAKPAREFPPLSPLGQEAVRALYDGGARYADDEMGKLLDAIQAKYPNSILIVTADHGEHLWEHDQLGHGITMYDAVLRVPFFMKGPGLTPQTIEANVSTIDILPTVAALLHVAPRPTWQGRDLFGPRDPQAPTFAYTQGALPPRNVDLDMVKIGSTKLIFDWRAKQAELYDVAADPGETANLASQHPEQVDQLKRLLEAHRQQNIQARVEVQRESVILDDETRRQLEALGYGPP